ncbi:unnamed protein product [Amoebophrya sp. A25]|nr:unnamed protein product [Amoebophrya sp. A25]|eukprot:GSA25T00003423001.1
MVRSFLPSLPRKVCITGARGMVARASRTAPPPLPKTSPKHLIQQVLSQALSDAHLDLSDLDGLVAVPSLTEPHFMEAHYQATNLGLFEQESKKVGATSTLGAPSTARTSSSTSSCSSGRTLRVRTIDTGGAGPVSALLEAAQMIEHENCDVVAVVAGDTVGSLSSDDFLQRADASCQNLESPLPSPVIPNGYDLYTSFMLNDDVSSRGTGRDTTVLTRDQLRLVPVLESWHSSRLPEALMDRRLTLEEVRASREVTKNISLLECARRADGAAAIVLASTRYLLQHHKGSRDGGATFYDHGRVKSLPVLLGGGEASGPLYPPERINESHFGSCSDACQLAYEEASLSPTDIDFFGLYDCFPVCFVRALQAAGVLEKEQHALRGCLTSSTASSRTGGAYLERIYDEFRPQLSPTTRTAEEGSFDYRAFLKRFPINTHGGLLCFGAPWEVPAAFNVVEAVRQLTKSYEGTERQIDNCRRALVYGNGGIRFVFSSSDHSVHRWSRPASR